jgi:hypothetical protein
MINTTQQDNIIPLIDRRIAQSPDSLSSTVLTLSSPYTHGDDTTYANIPGMSFTIQPSQVWEIDLLLVFLADFNGYKLRFYGENVDFFKQDSGDTSPSNLFRSPVLYEYKWDNEGLLPAAEIQVSERVNLIARIFTGASQQTIRLQSAKLQTDNPGGAWQINFAQIIARRIG